MSGWTYGWMDRQMDGWMREFNVTFAKVRPNRQAGTMVMRRTALVTQAEISNITETGTK